MGKTLRQIFEDAGFNIQVIGIKRIKCTSNRCRKGYKEKGVLDLDDKRTLNSGRILNRELILEEILAKKDAEIEYLKTELGLVKKLEINERQVRNHRLKPIKVFELIKNIISKFNLRGMIKYLCQIAAVSTSGYYKFLKSTELRKHRVIENKLNREFKQNIPEKIFLTDITFMSYGNNKIEYLSTVKDSSTNEILAYNLSNSFALKLVAETIDKLVSIESFKLHKDTFIHSDQGIHYTSPKLFCLSKII